jgi:diguanylate cyclase (GGDEF)-like protein/PAS domain S-box-containing protein/putative nucleotidyltransferase with HDIG domain
MVNSTKAADIIIVDDDVENLKILRDMLKEQGHNVRTANSGELALASIKAKIPDLVLLDIRMPGIDGYEVCRRIKADHNIEDITIIFLTGLTDQEDKVKGFKLGGSDYIIKPFRAEEVLARVDNFIKIYYLQQELKNKNRRLGNIIKGTNAGTWEWNVQTGEQIINERWAEIIGYTMEELAPISIETWRKYTYPEDVEKSREEIAKAFNKEQDYYDLEFRMYHKDGRLIWVNSRGIVNTWTQDGKPLVVSGVHIDINENIQIREQLKRSEEKFQMLFNQAPLGYQSLDFDGNFLDVNQQWLDMLGYAREEVIGKWFGDFLSPAYQDGFRKRFPIFKAQGHIHSEFEMVSKTGEKMFIAFDGKIGYGIEGDFKQTHCILKDITNEKILELKLSNEKKLVEATLLSVGDGVISCDRNGNVLFMNLISETLTGWKKEEAIGKPIHEVFNIISEVTGEISENIVEKVLLSGTINELANHTMLISRDGTRRPIEDSAAPIIQDNGEVIGVVLVFRDFTDKREKMNQIEYLSYHDYLTGLYNRRFFEEELKRYDTPRNIPITIVMGDVNGLKLINDSFGHDIGDELLKKTAEIIMRGCRSDDIVARLGGDEFVIILPKTDTAEAEILLQRIQNNLSEQKVGAIALSVSFGFDTKHNEAESSKDILKNAEDHMYRHKLYESASMRSKTINLIMNTLYEKNHREMLHSKRVSEICESIARQMDYNNDDINQIKIAGLMHDIGKIGIEDNILNKAEKLNDQEWGEIRKHSEIGYRILSSVNEFSEVAEYVLEHQERWDGNGYPRGLKGDQISLQARIICIADAYDAMTGQRTYGKTITKAEAISEIQRCSGKQFDPYIVDIFVGKVLTKDKKS